MTEMASRLRPLRPMFSYYGSKWTMAKHLGSPTASDLVIEPFAGSAAFSLYWSARRCRLFDLSPDICELWDFLINCRQSEIELIPDRFKSFDQVDALPRGANLLVRFWVSKGRAEPSRVLSPWYHRYAGSNDCKVWGSRVKRRIIEQKPMIANWSIDCRPWWEIPDIDDNAFWYVDPPYSNQAGSRYPLSEIDYDKLGEWVRLLPGRVVVSEAAGASWLPFRPLRSGETTRGKRTGAISAEAVWRNYDEEG